MSPAAVFRIRCAGALLALSCLAQQTPDQRDKCSVTGQTTSKPSGEPLRKVNIYLIGSEGKPPKSYVAVSDAEGHFSIENVDPGSYRLKGERFGYLSSELGAKEWGGKGSELQLAAGDKLSSLHLELIPQGVISGRVVDQDGDPWTHGWISACQVVWKKGKLDFIWSDSESLNDRGEFRVAGLQPGRYFVQITPEQNGEHSDAIPSVRAKPEREQVTWYPNALDSHEALALLLRAGQEISGIEIRLRKSPVFRITGKVTGLPAERGEGRLLPSLTAIPKIGDGPHHGGSIQPGGTFEVRRVPPGQYTVELSQAVDSLLSLSWATLGQTSVTVTDQDVSGVVVDLTPPRRLEGHVRIEGSEQFQLSKLAVGMSSVSGHAFTQPVRVKEDGAFLLELVGADRYNVEFSGDSEDVYLKTIHFGDTESTDGTLDLAHDKTSKVELLLSAKGARIQGTVRPDGAAREGTSAKDYHVWLIPDTTDLEQRERGAKAAIFNQAGAFTIRNIAPGSYTLYAWQDLPDDIWRNPEFLPEIKANGTDISLAEGDRKQVEAPLIPSSTIAALRTKLGIE